MQFDLFSPFIFSFACKLTLLSVDFKMPHIHVILFYLLPNSNTGVSRDMQNLDLLTHLIHCACAYCFYKEDPFIVWVRLPVLEAAWGERLLVFNDSKWFANILFLANVCKRTNGQWSETTMSITKEEEEEKTIFKPGHCTTWNQ